MKKLLIVGLGLIGGSLAKASEGFFEVYALNRSQSAIEAALREKTIQKGYCRCEEIDEAPDVICLCVPVDAMAPYAELLGSRFPGALFTDAGSTKGNVMKVMQGRRYVGTHPMAGSERSGYGAARRDLFLGATFCVVPGCCEEGDPELMEAWIRHMGGRPLRIGVEEHDRAVAAISHLPHVIASALTRTAEATAEALPQTRVMAAGGFLDITRIAGSDPVMWRAIFTENAAAVLEQLETFEGALSHWREMLQKRDTAAMGNEFCGTREIRTSFKRDNFGIFPEKGYTLRVRGSRQLAAELLLSEAGNCIAGMEFHGELLCLHCDSPAESSRLAQQLRLRGIAAEENS